MPLLLNNKVYTAFHYSKETDFEKDVETIADQIFGASSIYISKKKRIKGSEIISIPDAYLIDMTDPAKPVLLLLKMKSFPTIRSSTLGYNY